MLLFTIEPPRPLRPPRSLAGSEVNGPMWRAVGQAFRHVATPLMWYYAVTLALPLANGAAQAGAVFVEHALVVLVFPLVLVVIVGLIRGVVFGHRR
jgi:hypothetical protein